MTIPKTTMKGISICTLQKGIAMTSQPTPLVWRFIQFGILILLAPLLCAQGCPTSPPVPDGGGGNGDAVKGAIRVEMVSGATDTNYDIRRAGSNQMVLEHNSAGENIEVPVGTYTLTQYFNADFVYATDVVVTEGNTTTVTLGAVRLVTISGSVDGDFAICSSNGKTVFSSYNHPNLIVTAPAGTFMIKKYFSPNMIYARDVAVTAGQTTDVIMGGLRYNGALYYDIYEDGRLALSYNQPGAIVTIGAGIYTLTEYFNDRNILGTAVIDAGYVTDYP